MSRVRARVVVDGRVQGVFFRDSTRREALQRGTTGWVRNLEDGRVEAVIEGEPGAVARVVEWMRSGPERALVTQHAVADETPEGLTGFEIH